MAKAGQIEMRAELAVQAYQQVEGEFTGYPGGIVVGGFEDGRVLFQVDADQCRALPTHLDGHGAQQGDRLALLEVAQRRSRKEHHGAPRGLIRRRQIDRLGEIGADRQHVDLGKFLAEVFHAGIECTPGNFHRHIADRLLERIEQQARLDAGTAAVLDKQGARPDGLGDGGCMLFENRQLGAGQVILRLRADLFEQLRTARIVEVLRGNAFWRLRQPVQHVGTKFSDRLRGSTGWIFPCGIGSHWSFPRRSPMNCQRSAGAKKLR